MRDDSLLRGPAAQKAESAKIPAQCRQASKQKRTQPHIHWDLNHMMLVRTYLSSSTIEGVGIFAAEPIKAGDVIWRLEPKFDVLFTNEDMETWPAHMDDFVERYCYAHRDQPGVWVLELDNGRFMNHSNNPNTNFEEFYAGYAVRDIAVGDELTCNYFDFDINFRGAFSPERETAANTLAR